MMLDRDQLIRRVAEKHRLVLTEDDPLIASVTLHEVIFEHHHELLVKSMDEQNARVVTALQTTIASARADQKREQERLLQTLNALHQKNLEEYGKVTENCLTSLRTLAHEAKAAKQNAKIAAGISAAFGIFFFCANLYLLLRR